MMASMIRTRDYLLLLIAIVFLLVGIGNTLIDRYVNTAAEDTDPVEFVETAPDQHVAVLENDLASTRQEKLSELRKKIAAHADLFIYEESLAPIETATATEVTATSSEPVLTAEQRCGNYAPYDSPWLATGLQFEVVEGARVLYRTNAAEMTTSTNTAVLYLPLSSQPSPADSCLETDVIGLTLGGSLIRNNDAALFRAAGADTLLGYALDGFPIYGTTDAVLDACGGRQVAGQYQYQIAPGQNTILRCFSGNPIAF